MSGAAVRTGAPASPHKSAVASVLRAPPFLCIRAPPLRCTWAPPLCIQAPPLQCYGRSRFGAYGRRRCAYGRPRFGAHGRPRCAYGRPRFGAYGRLRFGACGRPRCIATGAAVLQCTWVLPCVFVECVRRRVRALWCAAKCVPITLTPKVPLLKCHPSSVTPHRHPSSVTPHRHPSSVTPHRHPACVTPLVALGAESGADQGARCAGQVFAAPQSNAATATARFLRKRRYHEAGGCRGIGKDRVRGLVRGAARL